MSIAAATLAKWGIPIALEMGHGWLQGRDVKKAQKKAEEENRRAQAMSNLINVLSPSARHQAYRTEAEYRPSGLTQALGAAKLGYGAYTGLKGAMAKEKEQALKIAAAERDEAIGAGEDYAAKAMSLAEAAGIKPGTEDWERITGVTERDLSKYGGDREGFWTGARNTMEGHIDNYLKREEKKGLTGGAGQLTQPKEVREQFKAIGIFEDKIVNLQRLLKENSDVLGHAPGGFESLKRLWQYDEKGRRSLRKPEGIMGLLQSAMPDALVNEPEYALEVEKKLGLVTQGFEDLASAWRNARETGVMTDQDFARAMRQVGGANVSYDQSSALLSSLAVGIGIEKSNLEKLYGPSPLDLEPPSLGVGAGKAAVVAGAQGGEEGPAWWEAPRMPSEVVDTATSNITEGFDQSLLQGSPGPYLQGNLEAEYARRQNIPGTPPGKSVVEKTPETSHFINERFVPHVAERKPYQVGPLHEGPDIKIVPSPTDGQQWHPLNTKEAKAISGVAGSIGRHLMEGAKHQAGIARDVFKDFGSPVKLPVNPKRNSTWWNESRLNKMKGETGGSMPPTEAVASPETSHFIKSRWGLSEEEKERRRKLGLYGGSSYYE